METSEKRINYPKTAYEFFLKLYCKKRGTFNHKDRNMSLAAVKAWVTLSEEEKRFFIVKYNECKMKHMAIHLEKMEPYMKKKPTKRSEEINFSTCESLDNNRSSVQRETQTTNQNIDKDLTEHNLNLGSSTNLTTSNIQQAAEQPSEQHNNTKLEYIEQCEDPGVSEPSPPSVRNSIELFNIIKSKEESDTDWSALSKAEKNRYNKAVYQLKQEYIKKYKTYLESLPSKELFIYYHKFDKNL